MPAYDTIYAVTRKIPPGKVATYGQIAHLAGYSTGARTVGYALHRLQVDRKDVPWHRVVNGRGMISYSPSRGGGDYLQRNLLEDEGIVFNSEGKIDLRVYLWHPESEFYRY